MGLKFKIEYRKLNFIFDAGTSRGVLNHKETWFIKAFDSNMPLVVGIGEAGPLKGLSIDDIPDFEQVLENELTKLDGKAIPTSPDEVFTLAQSVSLHLPSVRFGIETALLDLLYGGVKKCFDNKFYQDGQSIQINGLVWMGDSALMQKRLANKINAGFKCIKVKIGAIDLPNELQLLKLAREAYDSSKLELRVDANGAFSYNEAQHLLEELHKLEVHSIEQPIKAGQYKLMEQLCKNTPVPIALDEELIGINTFAEKEKLLLGIRPQYIILKPLLLGGFKSCLEWIELAERMGIGWWLTSALESNIGLNAICQFASSLQVTLPQGLGTGSLYDNNVDSPLEVVRDFIHYNQSKNWEELNGD